MSTNDSKTELVRVGKVKDAHGIKGELFIILFAGEAAWLNKLSDLQLVSEDGGRRQYKLKSVRIHKNGLIAKTEEIKDRNEAESLRGWLMEVPGEFFVSKKGEALYLREIQGFKVFEKAKGEVGKVDGFASNGAQDLLVIQASGGEYEIPFVEAFVERIDFDTKEIHLDLPEGLLGESGGDDEQ